MQLTIEKTQQAKSLEKMDFTQGEMLTFHLNDGSGNWRSYCMSPKFLDRMLSDYQNKKEADRAFDDLTFKPINGHSFLGVDNPDDEL